jgi:prepilin-type N-terminal cleavage/methylation domain-containing protein
MPVAQTDPQPDHDIIPRNDPPGFTLLELLVVLAIAFLVLGIGVPKLLRASARLLVSMAAHEVAAALQHTRIRAVRLNAHVALRLTRRDGRIHWAIYADGDGDGVRTRDIRRGVDPQLRAPLPLRRLGASVRPGFPDGRLPRNPNGRGRLHRRKDPLRFGRSDLVSFGPLGTCTSGSLYMTDGARWTAAVRVYGTTGKIRVIVYDPETETWTSQ